MNPSPRTEPTPTTVLVCAAPDTHPEPQVVLADGCYETGDERVFWRRAPDAEVLRLALGVPVSIRPVQHVPAQRSVADGEQRLLAALNPHRPATPRSEGEPLLQQRLTVALEDGRGEDAERAARLLREQAGLATVHDAISSCLAAAGARWAAGDVGVLTGQRQAAVARTLLERLSSGGTPLGGQLVVLAVPPGDRHTLALTAIAHQVGDAGHPTLVVDDLPLDELAELAADPGTMAVVISAHVPIPVGVARRFLAFLREAAPDVLLVAGGPGMPPTVRVADLVTSAPAELLRVLAGRTDPLTDREREVLLAVADGLTNGEIAVALGVSPATVKTHLDHVFAKTGTEHRAAAVARALRQSWIT